MTVLEQSLFAAIYALIIVIGVMRTHIKETGKLLAQARADRATGAEENRRLRAEMIADTYGRAEQVKAITENLHAMNGHNIP